MVKTISVPLEHIYQASISIDLVNIEEHPT